MTKKIYLTVLGLISAGVLLAANPASMHRTLAWKEPITTHPTDKLSVTSLFFEGASYDEQLVPVYMEKIPLEGNVPQNGIRVQIENAQYEPFKEINLLPKLS